MKRFSAAPGEFPRQIKNTRELWCTKFWQSSDCSFWCIYVLYVGIEKQMANNSWTVPTRISSMVTHYQLPPYEFHWATRQARDIAISVNSLGTWFFSKEQLRDSTQRLLEITRYRTEQRGGRLPTCDCKYRCRPKLSLPYNTQAYLQNL
jgi:hypothetical protein